ncbi:transposase [Thermoflavifilum thermophilum]|uniref:REP element-mobilizing transposase RayT n=1 Tax=Thermoflavifilum thermophilum TaxID=1393122 RepID=A0A1I7NI58_9BACT|nr:transposase [Thermoflavifilum thermophilum]SFV34330.1 REP element-mobilizing transposase RayT [Thermoflavifilum thermophilum]
MNIIQNNNIHHRRSIRLRGYDYSSAGAYFITICTHNRECLFGDIVDGKMRLNEWGEIAQQCWLQIPNHFTNTSLDEFMIMPNHMHGIITINGNTVGAIHELPLQNELPLHSDPYQLRKMLLPKIIGYFKMNVAKQINEHRQTPGQPMWQRNYYEHIIRDDDDLNRIREYIINNPLKWESDEHYSK